MYVGMADESVKYTDCESETVGEYDIQYIKKRKKKLTEFSIWQN